MMGMCMNRKLKRVPLDFDWPLNKVWFGYCPDIPKDLVNANQKWRDYFWEHYIGIEPPKGEGYQCWETTSEGSPITPVFKTFNKLCQWLEDNPKGITKTLTKEDWKQALEEGFGVVDLHSQELWKK